MKKVLCLTYNFKLSIHLTEYLNYIDTLYIDELKTPLQDTH